MNNFESKASGSLSSTELRTLPRVGQALVEAGAISVHQLREALRQQSMGGQRLLLGEVLLQMELVDRTTLLQAVARTLEIEFVPEPAKQADAAVMKLLPESMRREHRVVPLRRENDLLLVATADPQNDHVRELAQRTCGLRVRFVASPEVALDAMLSEAVNDGAVQEKAEEIGRGPGREDRPSESLPRQPREPAGMIDVPVGEDDGLDRGRRNREAFPIALAKALLTLEQSAVDEDPLPVMFEQMPRAGDGSRGPEETQRRHQTESLLADSEEIALSAA